MTTTSSVDVVCARIAQRLAAAVGPRRYAMWFDRSARFDYDEDRRTLEVAVPNQFVADWVSRNFAAQVLQAAAEELGQGVELRVQVKAEMFPPESSPAAYAADRTASDVAGTDRVGTDGTDRLRTARTGTDRIGAARGKPAGPGALRHNLADFIVGPSNKMAFDAVCLLADQEQQASNTIFIHGGCGLGKTHLLQGLCTRMLDRQPEARVLYLTGEQFTNEFLAAVRANNVAAFRKKIRRLDLLALDDVHFLANKTATQQEFLHSFDALDLGGARLALASDSHPKLIKLLNEALVSRCVGGLVAEVKPPDTATRARIVRALALKRRMPLVDTVIEVLAARCAGSVREIEGTLAKLHALATLSREHQGLDGEAVGHELVNRLFDSQTVTPPRRAVRFSAILDAVSAQLDVPKAELLSSSRRPGLVTARSLTIHLTRLLTGMSYPEIAAAMGRTAHSTIITADQRLAAQAAAGRCVVLPATLEELPLPELIARLKRAIAAG